VKNKDSLINILDIFLKNKNQLQLNIQSDTMQILKKQAKGMRIGRFLLGTVLILTCCSFKLADRVLEGMPGDYMVTEQDRNYSLLLLRESREGSLLFEEVSVPSHMINKSSINWKEWMTKGAPGHSSWIQYEIDPKTFELLEAYSFSKKGWLYLDESDHFLSKLLSLPLTKIEEGDRKKIGPAPKEDDQDRRKVWNPPFMQEGEKIKASTEAWKACWPEDSSLLSSCQITLYFPPKELSAFPSWIEANNGHFSYSIKMIDSGKQMTSSLTRRLPHRPPQMFKHIQKSTSHIEIPIKASPYYKSFSLFAFDLAKPGTRIGPIEFEMKEGTQKDDKVLNISIDTLSSLFERNHHYKWLLMPQGTDCFIIESEDFFRFGSQTAN
jgi:hypothetical protein